MKERCCSILEVDAIRVMSKMKQFRYMLSNIAGAFNDAVKGGIDYTPCEKELKYLKKECRYGNKDDVRLPDYYDSAIAELKSAYKVKKECEKFISKHTVVSVTVNNYTTHRHNNGCDDTVYECVTIIYEDTSSTIKE